MPVQGQWGSVADFLVDRTGDEPGVWRRIRSKEVLLDDGTVVGASTTYRPGRSAYLYRDLPEEVPVPWELTVLLQDEETGLLAVDKPPFLATMPRGAHVVQSAVVRLRRDLDLPELSPLHRLDRLTSGVLLLAARAEVRSAYQRMVQDGGLSKTYQALAPLRPDLELPLTVCNRLVKRRGSLQTVVEEGAPNAITRVELIEPDELARLGDVVEAPRPRSVGCYRLTPTTGQTHQLRIHLAGLGIPILGDPLYPKVTPVDPRDFTTPLQLLAQEVRFLDPITGVRRVVRSRQALPILGVGY